MPRVPALIREPLTHFLLIGGVVFALFAIVRVPESTVPLDAITVTPQTARQLADRFSSVWLRPPRPDELDSLIDEYVREEILVREALELSMDRDDVVVRQRLAQKMRFVLESASGSIEPTEEDLLTFYNENAGDYAMGARAAFEQVFLGTAPTGAEVDAALTGLRDAESPDQVGQRTLLPAAMPMAGLQPVDATFGAGFFDRIEALEPGQWAGPVPSGYGSHLVRVTERTPAGMPDFADVRERVEADWRRQQSTELAEELYARIADGYEISRPSTADLAGLAE